MPRDQLPVSRDEQKGRLFAAETSPVSSLGDDPGHPFQSGDVPGTSGDALTMCRQETTVG